MGRRPQDTNGDPGINLDTMLSTELAPAHTGEEYMRASLCLGEKSSSEYAWLNRVKNGFRNPSIVRKYSNHTRHFRLLFLFCNLYAPFNRWPCAVMVPIQLQIILLCWSQSFKICVSSESSKAGTPRNWLYCICPGTEGSKCLIQLHESRHEKKVHESRLAGNKQILAFALLIHNK